MTQRFFVDASGNYLGSFDGAAPPPGAVEVPSAPVDARQKWTGSAWSAPPGDAIAAGSARRARRFRKALAADPVSALVQQALET